MPAPIHGAVRFWPNGWTEPLTGYEPQSLIEVNSDHALVNFLESTASTPTSMTLLPQSLRLTSPKP